MSFSTRYLVNEDTDAGIKPLYSKKYKVWYL